MAWDVENEEIARCRKAGTAYVPFRYDNGDTRKQLLARAESFNAKVKAFRSQFRGVTDIPFFLFRVSKPCA